MKKSKHPVVKKTAKRRIRKVAPKPAGAITHVAHDEMLSVKPSRIGWWEYLFGSGKW